MRSYYYAPNTPKVVYEEIEFRSTYDPSNPVPVPVIYFPEDETVFEGVECPTLHLEPHEVTQIRNGSLAYADIPPGRQGGVEFQGDLEELEEIDWEFVHPEAKDLDAYMDTCMEYEEHFGGTTRVYFLSDLKRWSDEGYEFGWNTATKEVITLLYNDDNEFQEDDTIYWVDMNHREFEEFIQGGKFDQTKVGCKSFEGSPKYLREWNI